MITASDRFHARATLAGVSESGILKAVQEGAEGGAVERSEGGWRVAHAFGQVALRSQGGGFEILLEAADRTSLAYLQLGLTYRLSTLDRRLQPDWESDNKPGMLLPYFREMRVVSVTDVTPRLRRVRLAGEDLARFARDGLHVRLLFPPEGAERPVWPRIGKNGDAVWPEDEDRPVARVYTIRRIDVARGLVEIDMVLHGGDDYPGAGWAARATPGDIVGMTGPGGGGVPKARKLVLLGDETALPAIGRILENLPEEAEAVARVEIADAAEIQPLETRAALDFAWLPREGRPAGSTDLLPEALKSLQLHGDDPDVFVWAGCEFSAFKTIRRHLRTVLRLPRAQHLAVAYWRRGSAGAH